MHGLPGRNALSSPPIVYKNLVITGGTTQENPPKGPAGDVRAWDMRTGKLVWTFRSIPAAGEKYNDTWAGDSWKNRSGVNVWGFLTVDEQRGIVYMPFGAPSVDQYGGDRAGDNLFSTSLVAADANTGKYLWHFQVVHHDIWDADMTGAPALIDVKQGGKTIPAVVAMNKGGLLFLLDRVTGKPIYGVEERPVPRARCRWSGHRRRSRFPLKPPPLSRMTISKDGHRDGHARTGSGVQEADRRRADGRAVSAASLQPPARAVSRQSRRRQLVRDVVQSAARLSVRQRQRTGADVRACEITIRRTGRRMANGQGNRVDPDGPYEGVPGGGRFSVRAPARSSCRASSRHGETRGRQREHRASSRGGCRSALRTACRRASRRPAVREMAARSRPPEGWCSWPRRTTPVSARSTPRPARSCGR